MSKVPQGHQKDSNKTLPEGPRSMTDFTQATLDIYRRDLIVIRQRWRLDLICRGCRILVGSIGKRKNFVSWFSPDLKCECGRLPIYDGRAGDIAGPDMAKALLNRLGFLRVSPYVFQQ